jgi:hypothetical protein
VAQRRAFEHSRIKATASTQRRVSSRLVELRTVPNQAPASAFPAAQRCALSSLVELSNRAESSSRARIPGRAASRFRTEPNQAPARAFPAAQRCAFEHSRTKPPRAYYGGASSRVVAAVRGASPRGANVVGTACAGCWRRFGPRRRSSSTCGIPSAWVLPACPRARTTPSPCCEETCARMRVVSGVRNAW